MGRRRRSSVEPFRLFPVRVQTHIGPDAPSDRKAISERARVFQPARAGEQKGDPRCKQSVTAAILHGHPRTARDFRTAACAKPAGRRATMSMNVPPQSVQNCHTGPPLSAEQSAMASGSHAAHAHLRCLDQIPASGQPSPLRAVLRQTVQHFEIRGGSRWYGRSQSADAACQEVATSPRSPAPSRTDKRLQITEELVCV